MGLELAALCLVLCSVAGTIGRNRRIGFSASLLFLYFSIPRRNRGYRKHSLLWEDDAYGERVACRYLIGMDPLNTELLLQGSYSREHSDFRLPVNQLKSVDADSITFAGAEPRAGDSLRQACAAGIRAPIVWVFGGPVTRAAQAYAALAIPITAVNVAGPTDFLDPRYAARYVARWEGANGSVTPVAVQESHPLAAQPQWSVRTS